MVVYIAFMWIIVLAAVLFIEYFNMFSHIGKAQLYADLVADGSAFIGNNGWGLDKDEAKDAKKKLTNYNKTYFDDTTVSIGFSHTAEDNATDDTLDDTVDAKAKLKTSMVTEDTKITKTKKASTQITYSGGMRIVLEAWKHTYNFLHSENGQTWYLWGGGHSEDGNWEQFADCSGFVCGVYRKCGYNVPPMVTGELERMGTLVGTGYSALEDARPGDIILYWSNSFGSSTHVGIYAGKHNGTHYQVHCSGNSGMTFATIAGRGPSSGAILAPVSSGRPKIMIRRLVNDEAKAYETPYVVIPGLSRNQTIIYLTLSSLGYSNEVIAAIMGNFAAEGMSSPIVREGSTSETNPWNTTYAEQLKNHQISKIAFVKEGWDRFEYNGHPRSEGYGIAQWTTTEVDNVMEQRKAKLWDFSNGQVYDLSFQIGFVAYELEQCNVWENVKASAAPEQYKNASYADFLNCKDPGEGAKMFLTHFEGVWDGTDEKRANYAKQIYSAIRNFE